MSDAEMRAPRPAPVSGAEQDEILKTRLAADDKYVRRIAKRLNMVASARNEQERELATLLLDIDLASLRAHIGHLQSIASGTSSTEHAQFKQEVDRIQSLRASEQERVEQLREELKTALETQRHRLEYENLAQKIVVYPSREEMEGTIQSLDERIASLKDEIKSYDDMSADTRTALNGFAEQLRGTHTKIAGALGVQPAEAPSMAREPSDAAPGGSAPEHDTPTEAAPEHTSLNPRASVFEPSKGTRKKDTKRTLEKDADGALREPQEPEQKRTKADGEDAE